MTLRTYLDEQKKIADAATPGPWVNGRSTYDGIAFDELPECYSSWYLSHKRDIDFIASARTSVPKLIAMLEVACETLTSISIPAPKELEGKDALDLVRIHEGMAQRTRVRLDAMAAGKESCK